MEHTANSSDENKRYNDESVLLDGLYEFHPALFSQLSAHEMQALTLYYLTGQEVPDNVFEYRAQLLRSHPEAEQEARAAFDKIRQFAGIREAGGQA